MMYAAASTGERVTATPGATATCPVCELAVTPKCGQLVTWHWAHQARADCDPWAEPDTAWHREWQAQVPADRREVVIGRHRADVVATDGTVVELQHSPIPVADIREREAFYRRMVWVFDAIAPYQAGRLIIRSSKPGGYVTFRWKHPRRSVATCRRPVLLDLGDGRLIRLGRIYLSGRCGGWGHLVDRDGFTAWMAGTAAA